MNETAAREVVLVRAAESTAAGAALWTDDDRAWASRAAAEVVGAGAPPERFIARRASLALERLAGANATLRRALRAATWRPWVGTLLVLAAFAGGFAIDRIGAPQRVNVLAFPLLGILAWNLLVYAAILVNGAWGALRRRGPAPGPIAATVARLVGGVPAAPGASRRSRRTGRAPRRACAPRASPPSCTGRRSRSGSARSRPCTCAAWCSSTGPAGRARSSGPRRCSASSASRSDPRRR
jgi:hypothetical protein